MTVNIGDWRHCVDRRNKCKLLYDLIKEQTGYESVYLLNDGRMDMHKKGDVSEETETIEDEITTASNQSTEAKAKESANLDTDASVRLSELADDMEIASTTLHTDNQDSSKQGQYRFQSLHCH